MAVPVAELGWWVRPWGLETCPGPADRAGGLLGSEQGQRARPIPSTERLSAMHQLGTLTPSEGLGALGQGRGLSREGFPRKGC